MQDCSRDDMDAIIFLVLDDDDEIGGIGQLIEL
jgi:hypothetical protein